MQSVFNRLCNLQFLPKSRLLLNQSGDKSTLTNYHSVTPFFFAFGKPFFFTLKNSLTMAEKYKLTYFNARGRAEPFRMIFALAGIEFEDFRMDFPQWPAFKQTTKWGFLPLLEINGESFGEATAIGNYLAKKYNLKGKNLVEELRVDEIVSAFGETMKLRSIFVEQDLTKKDELKKQYVNEVAKPLLTKVTALKEKNGGKWIVGQNVTLADIYLRVGIECIDWVDSSVLGQFPALKKLYEDFGDLPQIKKWILNRPNTPV